MGDTTEKPGPDSEDDCVECDDDLWLPGGTPMFVEVLFTDITDCGAPPAKSPNGVWTLEQDPDTPCWWEYTDADYVIIYWIRDDQTHLVALGFGPTGDHWFNSNPQDTCVTEFDNDIINCNPLLVWGTGGHGSVTML